MVFDNISNYKLYRASCSLDYFCMFTDDYVLIAIKASY
jgi:hypothetical protein